MGDTDFKKCMRFLKYNGWEYVENKGSEYDSYGKDDCVGVDIKQDEIVFISVEGDFLHMPMCYYALVGALIEYRQLPINFISA